MDADGGAVMASACASSSAAAGQYCSDRRIVNNQIRRCARALAMVTRWRDAVPPETSGRDWWGSCAWCWRTVASWWRCVATRQEATQCPLRTGSMVRGPG